MAKEVKKMKVDKQTSTTDARERASKTDYWLTPDGLTLLRAYARDGLTYKEIAKKMDITEQGFHKFLNRNPQVREALQQTRELVDYMVENALLKSALGYTVKESKTKLGRPDKFGNRKLEVEETTKEIPPNPTSIAIWLNNRNPEKWKRNRDGDVNNGGNLGKGITVNIIKHGTGDNYSATSNIDDEWGDDD